MTWTLDDELKMDPRLLTRLGRAGLGKAYRMTQARLMDILKVVISEHPDLGFVNDYVIAEQFQVATSFVQKIRTAAGIKASRFNPSKFGQRPPPRPKPVKQTDIGKLLQQWGRAV